MSVNFAINSLLFIFYINMAKDNLNGKLFAND